MVICGPTIDEAIAGRVLTDRPRILPPILDDARERLAIVRAWIEHNPTFEWIEPSGGVVGLVRFRDGIEIDTTRFYERLLADHGTYVGPGHWFEVDDRCFRLGYGWPTIDELRAGLTGLDAAAASAAAFSSPERSWMVTRPRATLAMPAAASSPSTRFTVAREVPARPAMSSCVRRISMPLVRVASGWAS